MIVDPNFIWKDIIEFENSGGIRQYLKSGTFLSEDQLSLLYKGVLNNAFIGMGAGGFNNSYQTTLAKLDKFKSGLFPPNSEQVGYTFITRPRLNLGDGNIRQHRVLSTLDTTDASSRKHNVMNIAFMMRCLLDTRFVLDHDEAAAACPLFDMQNPFFTPLCNCLTDISGWPDFSIETETTEGGFHNEDIVFSKGSDMLNRSGELNLGFKDISGGTLMAMFYIWLLYMGLQNRGDVIAYEDDIYEQRLNYTVSIYRFVMDPSRQYITKWAKATGCFPKSVPIGSAFNFNEGEVVLNSTRQISIPFAYNKVEYNDSGIIRDFNRLMRSYVAGIDSSQSQFQVVPNEIEYNFLGYPYINTSDRGLKLEFRAHASDVTNYYSGVSDIEGLVRVLATKQAEQLAAITAPEPSDEVLNYEDLQP